MIIEWDGSVYGSPQVIDWTGGIVFIPTRGGTYRRALWSWLRNAARVRSQWQRVAVRQLPSWNRVAVWRHSTVSAVITPHTFTKTASDDRTFGFDYSDAPEVWDGDSVVDAVSSGTVSGGSGLTFGTPAALGSAFDDIPASAGLSCRISGGTAGTTYLFAMVATLASGRVLTIPCRMIVVADVPSS